MRAPAHSAPNVQWKAGENRIGRGRQPRWWISEPLEEPDTHTQATLIQPQQ